MLDPSDAADLLDVVREEHGLAKAGRRTPRKGLLLDLYSRSVNTGRPLSRTVAETAPWCADLVEPLGSLFGAYVARKRARALLDFDDLLLYWRAAVRDDVLGGRLAGLFDAVLVDEYQDVNQLQVDIVRGLCGAAGTGLTAVGDDAQAVYGFRGASARHILDLPEQFPGSTVVRLVRNYRSTQPILDLADAVWAGAGERYAKTLVAVRPGGALPELVDCDDEAGQSDYESTIVAPVHYYSTLSLRSGSSGWISWSGYDDDLVNNPLCGQWNSQTQWQAWRPTGSC